MEEAGLEAERSCAYDPYDPYDPYNLRKSRRRTVLAHYNRDPIGEPGGCGVSELDFILKAREYNVGREEGS